MKVIKCDICQTEFNVYSSEIENHKLPLLVKRMKKDIVGKDITSLEPSWQEVDICKSCAFKVSNFIDKLIGKK